MTEWVTFEKLYGLMRWRHCWRSGNRRSRMTKRLEHFFVRLACKGDDAELEGDFPIMASGFDDAANRARQRTAQECGTEPSKVVIVGVMHADSFHLSLVMKDSGVDSAAATLARDSKRKAMVKKWCSDPAR